MMLSLVVLQIIEKAKRSVNFMERETKLKWLIVVGVLFLLSYMSYLGNLKQQSNVEPPNPVTTPGDIVATFDNGDGTENYIRKNEKVMQLEVNYPKNIKNNHFLFGMKITLIMVQHDG